MNFSIQYSCIHMATHSGRCFFLTHIETNGESQALGFKLESALTANAIYRAVTEKHAFYSCETVRNTVTTQFIRDLKGTIFSLFNENTTLGKNYVFDIRRTCREVYDHTRRELYQLEAIAKSEDSSQTESPQQIQDLCLELEHSTPHSIFCKKSECKVCKPLDILLMNINYICFISKDMKDRLEALQDSMLCRICFDAEVCTAFNCGHVVCCESCAPQCDRCPLCRCLVTSVQKIYLPLSRTGLQQTTNCDTKCWVPLKVKILFITHLMNIWSHFGKTFASLLLIRSLIWLKFFVKN